MKHNIVLGPPGTGKTTYLLNTVDKLFTDGVRPYELGYLAFTKKAANEALSRAMKKFDYDKEELPYFRTIHSMCYFWQGLTTADILDRKALRMFSEVVGERISSAWDGENYMALSSKGDQMLFLENMARNMCVEYKDSWSRSGYDISWLHFDWFCKSYVDYKDKHFLKDYTDMLSGFLQHKNIPELKAIIVDEAQDLSQLQWRCIYRLAEKAKYVYFAGDDDQAIYTWAGADTDEFINLKGNNIYLEQSYRVPKKVHDVAFKIVNRIKNRKPKTWLPRSEEGDVSYHKSFEHIDMSKGEWLVLARNNYLLSQVEEYLKTMGYFYYKNNKPSISEVLIQAIKDWEKLRSGGKVKAEDVRKIYNYMRAGVGVKKGYKTMKQADPKKEVDINKLKKEYGLLVDKIWHECFDLLGDTQKEYIVSSLRKGEKTMDIRIRLSTIHAIKGGECDNVILLTDLANRTYEELYKNPDDECRAFYVGVTRTKKHLHIISSKTRREFNLWI